MRPTAEVLGEVCREVAGCVARVQAREIEAAVGLITGAPRVFAAGAGRSGLMVRAFAMRLMHAGMAVHVVGEPTTPAIGVDDLLLVGSGSGRTASLVSMATRARELGSRIVLLTIDRSSPLALLSDAVVVIPASSPKVVSAAHGAAPEAPTPTAQPMGSLFEQSLLLTLDGMLLLVMERLGLDAEAMFARHANLE